MSMHQHAKVLLMKISNFFKSQRSGKIRAVNREQNLWRNINQLLPFDALYMIKLSVQEPSLEGRSH